MFGRKGSGRALVAGLLLIAAGGCAGDEAEGGGATAGNPDDH
jgi:hypothetical protein